MSGMPVGLRLLRPDGIEVEKRQPTGDQLGAYRQSFALPRDARIGAWPGRAASRLEGAADRRRRIPCRRFVPPQLKVELAAADGPIRPAEAFPVDVAARYYYGAPGAGLAIEAEATIALDDDPFPTHPGYRFGLVDEEFTGDRRDIEAPSTDDNGKTRLSVMLRDLPDLTRPLRRQSGSACSSRAAAPLRDRGLGRSGNVRWRSGCVRPPATMRSPRAARQRSR